MFRPKIFILGYLISMLWASITDIYESTWIF